MRKVLVVGLDGLEPSLVSKLLRSGELPNLAKLQAEGGCSTVSTTYPAQTPVAWSSFATGVNPGAHGIFDFVNRNPETYLPDLGLNRYEQKSAVLPPKVINLRRAKAVWETLSEVGISSTVLRCPCTYPPDDIRGRMLSGMGVPDLRGSLGTSTFYTTDPEVRQQRSENVVHMSRDGKDAISTHLLGPRNTKTRSSSELPIKLHIDETNRRVILRSSGDPKDLVLQEGQWSDWLRAKFKLGILHSAQGIVRFYLRSVGPVFDLFASPVNFDPNAVLLHPISSPQDYADELANEIGPFYTTGMVEDHAALDNGRLDEAAYLAQCDLALKEREAMMLYELERFDEGLLFCLFDTPDRVQHMFWRCREPDHPTNRLSATPEMAHVIEDYYRKCDAIVGKALEYADDQTLFIALSDHGFTSFQRGIHLNTWLYENGFLTLRKGVTPGDENGDFFPNVDWGQTKAYALGLGSIYLNLQGREAEGRVAPHEAEEVQSAIAKGLTGLVDPERGQVAVHNVVTREQVYSGEFSDESPDLLVNFAKGYRVSWPTGLGGIPEGYFEDNVKKWSGDHIVEPSLVPGFLTMNRPFVQDGITLMDLAPTILEALGVPVPPEMEGKSRLCR